LPYAVAYIGWARPVSCLTFSRCGRSSDGRSAWPWRRRFRRCSPHPGRTERFLTASLIGGTLVLLPTRPVLSGICLGLLSYKPQYGLLFPLVLIAASQWQVFFTAAAVAAAMAAASWLAFGSESWQAFVHWLPMFSQAFLTEAAPIGARCKHLRIGAVLRRQRAAGVGFPVDHDASVAVALVLLWRSRIRYSLKAAALAVGTLLVTPYLFLYDLLVLAIPVAFVVRLGLSDGFRRYELPALGLIAFLLMFYPLLRHRPALPRR